MISAALLEKYFDHRAGLSFLIKYLCHSSDISFHTWLSRSDKNSSYSFLTAFVETSIQALCNARPILLQSTLCFPSQAEIQGWGAY